MNSILNYTPLHILVFFCVGILFHYQLDLDISMLFLLGMACLCLILIRFYKFSFILLAVAAFLMGMISIQIKKSPKNRGIQETQNSNEIIFSITHVLKETSYYHRYYADVIQVASIKTNGKILVRIAKDSTNIKLSPGVLVVAKTELENCRSPENPYGFDYKLYLQQNNIQEQLVLQQGRWLVLSQENFSIKRIAHEFREKLKHALAQRITNNDVLAITFAMLLGERDYVSKQLQESYVNAGVIHILAVSGLHIGIIVLILNFLLQPLKQFPYGKYIVFFLIVWFLWMFAFVAGLSASVVRAVTMFSFISLGIVLKNKSNVFYALITSALLLLIVNPYYLFSLGFKMSYIAVISIVILHPIVKNLWIPKYKIVNYFWNLITVSIAAQIGILPISLYYFHQFPSLFVLSNLVIIPCLSLILMFGFLILLISLSSFQVSLLFEFYTILVDSLNKFIAFMSNQEEWIFNQIYFSEYMLVVSYMLLISFVFLFQKITFQRVYMLLCVVILFQATAFYELYRKKNHNELIVYQQYKKSLIAISNNGTVQFYGGENFEKSIIDYLVKTDTELKEQGKEIPSLIKYKNQKILVIDKEGFYKVPNFHPEIIIIRNSPKINLQRCIAALKPRIVIADGSNYPSLKKKWRKTSQTMKIDFHDTQTQGAFVLK